MTTLQIVLGTSFFTGMKVVGIALKGTSDSVAFVRWADKVEGSRGRPAAVQCLNGHKSEAAVVDSLRASWQEWADKSGIQITIAPKPRTVSAPF